MKVLIANRGECALRLIRACREMGIRTVAIYSAADAGAPHTRAADEAHLVGPAAATQSYLAQERIIAIAQQVGADALHPGWGFLAENAAFARRCRQVGLTFIGPPAEAIEALGDKSRARQMMRAAGVPIIPGSDGIVNDSRAAGIAEAIGYPLMVKASAGGGGIGLALVREPAELSAALESAHSRAQRAFGDGSLYLEKFVAGARHIEVQIVADTHGHIVAFPERECSIQRRHQKVIEETPSPAVDVRLRGRMRDAAVRAARVTNYANLGTIEFLLDRAGDFYFLEMNTRLQVEHGITEMIAGVDLVKVGITLAADELLSLGQEEIRARGHAVECRIYAEDPYTFWPAPGRVSKLVEPVGPRLRLESGLVKGATVTPFYDPLVAKLLAWGETREEALDEMRRGLESYVIEGIKTNIPLHLRVLSDERFVRGEYDTGLLVQ